MPAEHLLRRGCGRDEQIGKIMLPQYADTRVFADTFLRQPSVEIINTRNRPAIHRQNNITGLQSSLVSGAAGFDGGHAHAAGRGQVIKLNDSPGNWHILSGYANIAAANLAVANQPGGDEFRGIGGNGKTNSLRGQNHSGIYAYYLTIGRHQRTAGVTGIQSSIRLDNPVN